MSSRHKRYANVLPRLQKLKGWFSISVSFQDTPDFAAQPGCILRFWFLRFAGNRPAAVLFWNPPPVFWVKTQPYLQIETLVGQNNAQTTPNQ